MIYLMLRRKCGHVIGFNYQHRILRGTVRFCRCEG